MIDSSLVILLLSVPGPKQKKKKEKDELKIEEEAKTSDTAEEKVVKNLQPPPPIPGRFSPCNVHLTKITSVFYASVLLLIMNFIITLSKWLWIHETITRRED